MQGVVFYHADCQDGFACAHIVHCIHKNNIIYVPCSNDRKSVVMPEFTEQVPWIMVLDYSFPEDVTEYLIGKCKEFIWLDHHVTAKNLMAKFKHKYFNQPIYYDNLKSGCELTWKWFHPHEQLPDFYWHIARRDLWQFPPNSFVKEVNSAIQSYPMTFEQWDMLMFNKSIQELIIEGSAILRYQQQIIDHHVKIAWEYADSCYQTPIPEVWCSYPSLISEIGHELCKKKPYARILSLTPDGKTQVSLRSNENGVDVSEIAKSFGGGGHKHAAGYIK